MLDPLSVIQFKFYAIYLGRDLDIWPWPSVTCPAGSQVIQNQLPLEQSAKLV